MKFKIDADEPLPRKPVPPVRDFTSWQFRMRIASLLAALLVVVFLMREARKPENWKWMGFREDPKLIQEDEQQQDLSSEGEMESGKDPKTTRIELSQLQPLEPNQLASRPTNVKPYPAQAKQFWRDFVAEIGSAERLETLFDLTKTARLGERPLDRLKQPMTRVYNRVVQSRAEFHKNLFDKISFMDDAERKEQLTSELFECKTIWNEKIRPGLLAAIQNEDLTLSQLGAVQRLQGELDQLAFELVLDEAPLNRGFDGPAAKRIWELATTTPDNPAAVKQIQLTGQPEIYRGQAVKVNGWLRRLEHKVVTDSDGNKDDRYIGWLRPADSNQMPYCVFFHTIPANLKQQLASSNSVDLNLNVEVAGYFFKIRTYVSAEEKILTCPLLFANAFQEIEQVGAETSIDESWRPGWPVWIAFFIVMPVIATMIAMRIYRGTTTRKFQPGKNFTDQLKGDLGALENDPDIQSDAEQVKAIEEKLGRSDEE